MAYSTNLLTHIGSLILIMRTHGYMSDCCRIALDVLANIGHRIDVPGSRRTQHLIQAAESSQAVEKHPMKGVIAVAALVSPSVERVSCLVEQQDCFSYAAVAKALVLIVSSMLDTNERVILLRVLDAIAQLAVAPENAALFGNMPASMVWTIADLMYANTTTADPLRLLAGRPATLRRPPAGLTLDFHLDVSDHEMRDAAIETVHSLCVNSVALREMFGAVPNLMPFLTRFIQAGNSLSGYGGKRDFLPPRSSKCSCFQL